MTWNNGPFMDSSSMRKMRRLHYVPRWCVVPTIQRQTVAEHTFGVATIAMKMMEWMKADYSIRGAIQRSLILEDILEHDKDEALTGDKPTPTKSTMSAHMSAQTKVVLKCADVMEAIVFLEEEEALGNRRVKTILTERKAAFHEWWQYFEWACTPRRPLSSDVIKYFVGELVHGEHPAMELFNEKP